MFKKAIRTDGLGGKETTYTLSVDTRFKETSRGIAGDKLLEPIPTYINTPSEKVIANENNSWIVLGRDRPGSRLSGYGGKGDTQCASMDLVVGRIGFETNRVNFINEQLHVDPNFKKDAARIYLSQKTDIDDNFGLAAGKVGNSKTKSGIGLKADGIRLIAREGIKLVTRTDIKNSQGGDVRVVSGIDIIAGNDDSDLQSMVKGGNMRKALERVVYHIDKLNGIVDAQTMILFELTQALTYHFHYSPFFGAPTSPSVDILVPTGIKASVDLIARVKRSLISHKVNLASFKITYLNPAGKNYICSRYNNVN